VNYKTIALSIALIISVNFIGCGEKSSSSSSSSSLQGLSSESKDRYNNLPPEGKAEFDKAMKDYDKSKR
jgi:hypothetical protein